MIVTLFLSERVLGDIVMNTEGILRNLTVNRVQVIY